MKHSLAALGTLHLAGNAAILWLGYIWLGLPESSTGRLLISVATLFLFACLALWLHGTAFVYFNRVETLSLSQAAVRALRHLSILLALAVFALALYAAMNWISAHLDSAAFEFASFLTLSLRKPIPPARILALLEGIVWLVQWLVLPVLFAPVAADVCLSGFQGLQSFRRGFSVRSLLIFPLALGAVWAPMKLLGWIPDMPNFSAEMASFLARAGCGYLLFTGLLLVLEWATSSGSPLRTQRSNSALP